MSEKPVVASYCATFLKPEMLHIYRQLTALERVQPIVITQKREHAERFPFDHLHIVPKTRTHFLRRIWYRQLRDAPWQISSGEKNALLRLLKAERAKLLHVYFGHIAVHLLPLLEESPSVVSFHGADVMVDLHKPAYRVATLRMLKAVRLVLVRSGSLHQAMVEIGCPENKIRLQRTGLPLAPLPYRAPNWPRDGAWRFVQACRLIEKKGLSVTLRAFASFVRQNPAAHLTIAGDGPLLERLQTEARALGIAQQVNFAGFLSQEKLRELFVRSHIFLHPSETGADGNQEGVPNSMLEAMAIGLPIFATCHGGIPEAIEHGVSGVLVAEGDAKNLARALLHYGEHPEMLDALALLGRKSVEEKFEQRAQARRLEDYYFEAMALSA